METPVQLRFRTTFLAVLFILSSLCLSAQCPSIVWADEFDNASLDLAKWSYQIGDGCQEGICGWGNNELQYYQEENVTLANGQLHITAKRERVQSKAYTSGRIRTINKGDFTYGRFEARIRLPAGQGLWPAFWMLPTDEVYGGWPQSGEIDIMEFVAGDPTRVLGTIHYGDPWPDNSFQGASFELTSGIFPDAFHDFAIEWESGVIRWFVDDILYSTKTSEDVAPHHWPFDQDFHFLLNVAVGGNLGGTVDNSIFPKVMDVEYVRVYNGFRPYIAGDRVVSNEEDGVVYSVGNVAAGTAVTWTVPSGASIVSGDGTSQIIVNFGSASGDVTASFNTSCGQQQLVIPVKVEPPFHKEFSFENFDEPATATLNTYTGTFAEVANPSPSGINTSALAGRYTRNSAEQYDVLVYDVSNITDADLYSGKIKKFYMDVYTDAPPGREILLQLETSTATSSNYPTGRHSRYVGTVIEQNQWQRIAFELLDRPDGAASPTEIIKMILLFASNTFTGDTYHFDNLDSYTSETANAAPVVSVTEPADGSSFAAGSSVNIAANASDPDGTISVVDFYASGALIGSDNTSPYAISWTIGEGGYSITATATDDGGLSSTSASVNVTGTGETGSFMFVSSIVTGTVSAGGGKKSGTASITILDQSGNPVSNATVTGTFSGTFAETGSAVTGSNGIATVTTTGSAKGSLTVNFCVTDVTHPTQTYNAAENAITCTGGSSASLSATEPFPDKGAGVSLNAYPNPFAQKFDLMLALQEESAVLIVLYDIRGAEIGRMPSVRYPPGTHRLSFENSASDSPLYYIKAVVNDRIYTVRQMRSR